MRKSSTFYAATSLFALLALTSPARGDFFVVNAIPREGKIDGQIDDFYFRINALYVNFNEDKKSTFWKSVLKLVGTNDGKLLITAKVIVNPQQENKLESLHVLASVDPSGGRVEQFGAVSRDILPPIRLQPADTIRIEVQIARISVEREGLVQKLFKSVEQIPIVNGFTKGALGTITSFTDIIINTVEPGENNVRKAELNINNAAEIAGYGYLAIVFDEDGARFKTALESKKIPLTKSALSLSTDRANLPNYVLLQIQENRSLFSPEQLLAARSPLAAPLKTYVESIANAETSEAKARACLALKAFARTQLSLTPHDQANAALAAMREGQYDPDRSSWHNRDGIECFTYHDLRRARSDGFRIGSCTDARCQKAAQFVNVWFSEFGNAAAITTKEIRWQNFAAKPLKPGEGSEGDFRRGFPLKQLFGSYSRRGEWGVSVLGALIIDGTVVDAEIVLTFVLDGQDEKIGKIEIYKTDKKIDGQRPGDLIRQSQQ